MSDEVQQDALGRLRHAIREAGGPSAVARKIRTSRSHLGNVLAGKRPLGTDVAGRLRAVVSADAEVWADLLAPATEVEE